MSIYEPIDEDLGEIDYNEFHKTLTDNVFIIRDIFESDKTFNRTFKMLYDYMKQGFEKKEVRTHPIRFKFKNIKQEPEKTMQVRHFVINMMYWYPFLYLDVVDELNDSHIYMPKYPTKSTSFEYINEKIILPYRSRFDGADINSALDDMVYLLSRINHDFAIIMGTTLDLESFSDLRERYPRFKELTEYEVPEGMQPKEIEDVLNDNLHDIMNIIDNDEDNNLKPFIVTGAGINPGQFVQLAINGGLKPDIEGNVIPIPINSSYIYKGLNSITSFYIDGQAGSKPLIMNKTVMGKSGHFAYKTMTLASSYRMSRKVHDCHSARPINFNVAGDAYLKKINGRYYLDDDDNLHVINYKKDKHLIGKTIRLRDPVTCCAKDGICHVCYGELWHTNKEKVFHIGRFAATQVNNPIQQKILSSKHMNSTRSNKIDFDKAFDRFFILNANKIYLNPDSDEDFNKWVLVINNNDLFVNDDMDKEGDFNYYTEKFRLYNKTTNKFIEIKDGGNHDIFFYGEVSQHFRKKGEGDVGVGLGQIDYETPIAIINIANNELSTPLKNIIRLLDRVNHYGCETIDDMVNKICQLTIESGMAVDNVHCSLLIKGLIRTKKNILLSPDFSDLSTCEDYQILTATNALIYNPSLTVSISFESMTKQIISPYTYMKYRPSEYDLSYKDDLYYASKAYYAERKEEKSVKKLEKKAKKLLKKRKILYGKKNS